MTSESTLSELFDRLAVTDTLYRYASSVDSRDLAGVRSVFADDATFVADDAVVTGADAIVGMVDQYLGRLSWSHHLVNVYHMDINGDEASALTYHTSHQIATDTPDTVLEAIARYRDSLRRIEGVWRITRKEFQVGWVEERTTAQAPARAKFLGTAPQ